MAKNRLVQAPPTLAKGFSALHRFWYRASKGRLGGSFHGAPAVLLTTTGARTGKERTWPLLGLPVGDGYAFAASNGGHDRHPAWYLNLSANPAVTVQVGGRRIDGLAREAIGAERDALWARFVEVYAGYGDYERATARRIPVVVVAPIGEPDPDPDR